MFNSCNLLCRDLRASRLFGERLGGVRGGRWAHEPFVQPAPPPSSCWFTIYDPPRSGGTRRDGRMHTRRAALGFLKKSSHSRISVGPASTPIIYETQRDWARLSQTVEGECDSRKNQPLRSWARCDPATAQCTALKRSLTILHRGVILPYDSVRLKGMSCHRQQCHFPNSEADLQSS